MFDLYENMGVHGPQTNWICRIVKVSYCRPVVGQRAAHWILALRLTYTGDLLSARHAFEFMIGGIDEEAIRCRDDR